MMRAVFFSLAVLLCTFSAAYAQPFTALARFDVEKSQITMRGGAYKLDLALSQGVPYRVYTLNDPARLVVDFREVDFAGVDPTALMSTLDENVLRFGAVRPG